MEARRRGRLGYSLRGLAILVLGLCIGLAIGSRYLMLEDLLPSEAFATSLPEYVVEPPDVLAIDIVHPDHPDENFLGQCLVGPDGRIQLNDRSMYVTGLTLEEIRKHLTKVAANTDPNAEVTVDVRNYNSKKYYLITKSPAGDSIVSLPITGNDTVLDALAQAGNSVDLAKQNTWISRPSTTGRSTVTLPVDYQAAGTDPKTNYQLLPGDRVFISPEPIPAP